MTNNKPAFVATVIVAVLAVAAVIFVLWKTAQDELVVEEAQEQVPSYVPTDAIMEEMRDAAETLIKNNYTVVKLYYTRGLPYEEEPYGNRPEGGYYYVNSPDYTSLEDVYRVVDETFFEDEAETIKTNPEGKGAVYAERDGRLAINENFAPNPAYEVDWSSPSYVVLPISDTECKLEITLQFKEADGSLSPVSDTRTMMKLNGVWKIDYILR